MYNSKMKQVVSALVVVALVVGGVYLVRRGKGDDDVMPEIMLEPTKQMVEELPVPMSMEEKKMIEDTFSKEGVEMTVLKDVSGGQGVGTGWRHFDGSLDELGTSEFVHKVEATGLAELDKGFFYEGWLVGPDGFFSTGRMAVVNGEGSLYYTADEDKSDFTGVVITSEPEDGDEAPDKHVLEGSF